MNTNPIPEIRPAARPMKSNGGKPASAWSRAALGFTLVEVLVSSAISMLVVAGALSAFLQYRRSLESQAVVNNISQNLRVGSSLFSRDLRLAGYGLRVSDAELAQWITWASMNANPKIENGAGINPDVVRMAAAYAQVAALQAAATQGVSVVDAGSGASSVFNTSTKKLIYIGRCELARITAIAGNLLTVSTSPTAAKGLRTAHPAGASIELVKVYEYSITPHDQLWYGSPPFLVRLDLASDGTGYWFEKIVSSGVEDLQVARDETWVSYAMRGRTMDVDLTYTDSEFGDHYHRMTSSNSVYLINTER